MALRGFFDADLLDRTRVTVVPRIADPVVFRAARALGMATPNSPETMAGMTVIDTIVIASGHRLVRGREDNIVLLFHELVHVVQFRVLGVQGMVRRYVRGWAECGYDYWSIPMEEDAYELGGRFAANPHEVFSVENEVRRRLGLPL